MNKSLFEISKMDCPSEETLIRMKLDKFNAIRNLQFDLVQRKLTVVHDGPIAEIEESINDLKLNSKRVSTEELLSDEALPDQQKSQKQNLWTVLLINFGFFLIEIISGVISRSLGLVADSLDMLADALVYGLSLYAVGKAVQQKNNIARMSGYFQIALAVIGFAEVIRRFIHTDVPPTFHTMIIVSILALIANGLCLHLLQKSRSEEAHMQASMIFTSNDIIINVGVIVAGILVLVFDSNKPDLVVGSIVFVIVIRGALRILKLSKG